MSSPSTTPRPESQPSTHPPVPTKSAIENRKSAIPPSSPSVPPNGSSPQSAVNNPKSAIPGPSVPNFSDPRSALIYARRLLANSMGRDSCAEQTRAARSAPRCNHVRGNGYRCGSPALRGRPFCFFHHKIHNRPWDAGFPPLEDAWSVQIAVMQVLDALRSGRLDVTAARTYLYGLRLAARVEQRIIIPREELVVRDLPKVKPAATTSVNNNCQSGRASGTSSPTRVEESSVSSAPHGFRTSEKEVRTN